MAAKAISEPVEPSNNEQVPSKPDFDDFLFTPLIMFTVESPCLLKSASQSLLLLP